MLPTSVGGAPLTRSQRALVTRHLKLVRVHLRRRVTLPTTATRTREVEDLFQEGCLGLIRAAKRYDARVHGAFEPYALARIRGSVHRALCDRFATVRIPARERSRRQAVARGPGGDADVSLPRVVALCGDSNRSLHSHPRRTPDAEPADAGKPGRRSTIGQHLREKHALALRAAADVVARRCRRPDTRAALEMIVQERLAIPCEHAWTPLRVIARRYNASIGRVTAWQAALERVACEILTTDDEFVRLQQAAHETELGFDGVVNAELMADLADRRRATFKRALAASDRTGRGLLVLAILENRGSDGIGQAARLFGSRSEAAQRRILAGLRKSSEVPR